MFDKFGKEVKVGDKIVTWIETGHGSGTTLQCYEVEKITERFVYFKYTRQKYKRYTWQEGSVIMTAKRTSEQFILLDSIIK
jgi:hypothetical protein